MRAGQKTGMSFWLTIIDGGKKEPSVRGVRVEREREGGEQKGKVDCPNSPHPKYLCKTLSTPVFYKRRVWGYILVRSGTGRWH